MVVLCKWRLHIISGGRNIHSKAFRWNSCIKKFTKVKVQALVEELTASGRRRWVAALSLRAGTVQLCGKFEVNNVSWISVSGNWKSRHCLRKWTSCQWRWLPSRKLRYSPDLTPSVCLFPKNEEGAQRSPFWQRWWHDCCCRPLFNTLTSTKKGSVHSMAECVNVGGVCVDK